MPEIEILSPLVADMIAAGEVVERPASVIKELMENAVDAGAKNVTVELRAGGAPYIRVTDDGCGMSPEDAGVAFLRHATSKLRSERDLEAIGTLGFRGEALAAISAVSRVEVHTRVRGAETGSFVSLEAGDIQEMRPAGCPDGTAMTVRDLFFNTPARFKFLKSDRAEAQSCVTAALRCALAHPEISVKCIRDGQDVFFSPGDGRTDSCVYSLLGRDAAQGFLKAESEGNGVSVQGFVSSPRAGRGNRAAQYFFCNGRPIHSLTLQSALEQAYKNTLMVGRFPACVLYITLSCAAVDVNVHPTKNEVKFSDERAVFDAVYHAALGALENENALPPRAQEASAARFVRNTMDRPAAASAFGGHTGGEQMKIPTAPAGKPEAVPAKKADFFREMTADSFRSELRGGVLRPAKPEKAPARRETPPGVVSVASPQLPYGVQAQPDIRVRHVEPPAPEVPVQTASTPEAPAPETPEARFVGEAFGCYILMEQGDDLILIDKHAAHERVLFDRLKAQGRTVMSQTMLSPVTLSPGAGDTELLLRNAAMLETLGFALERFGEESVILRAVPADTDETEARAMLEEILETLRRGETPDGEGALDEILHTIACKAAIKAGKSTTPQELEALAARVLSGEVRYCPHGRPVSMTLSKKELDRRFGRLG